MYDDVTVTVNGNVVPHELARGPLRVWTDVAAGVATSVLLITTVRRIQLHPMNYFFWPRPSSLRQ